jgi:hypothetical protein
VSGLGYEVGRKEEFSESACGEVESVYFSILRGDWYGDDRNVNVQSR